jgi:hypothetical protein
MHLALLQTQNASPDLEAFYAYLAQFDSKRSAEHTFHTLIDVRERPVTPSESCPCGVAILAPVALSLAR